MTKRIKNSLLFVLIMLCVSFLCLSFSFSAVKAETYEGLKGSQETVTGAVTLEDTEFKVDGAQIRADDTVGIRFVTKVSKTAVAEKLPTNAKFGTIVLPTTMLNGATLSFDTQSAAKGYAQNYYTEGDYWCYNVVLASKDAETGEFINLDPKFYNTEFTVVSFVDYTYTDATDNVTQKDGVLYTQEVQRTPRIVANTALANDGVDGEWYDSNQITALKAIAKEEGKIAYFDSELGVKQVTEHSTNEAKIDLSYSTYEEAKGADDLVIPQYGDEAGYMKLTCSDPDGEGEATGTPGGAGQAFYLNDYLIEKDLSIYEYIEFAVWSSHSAYIHIYNGIGKTTLRANEWMKVRVNTADITTASDITNLIFCFSKDSYVTGPVDGSYFYITSIKAYNKPTEVADKIAYFDDPYGISQINKETGETSTAPMSRSLSYTTKESYGTENGSLKVVIKGSYGAGQTFKLNENIMINNLSGYDYVMFYVKTDGTGKSVSFHNGVGKTTLTANEWTRVKVSVTVLKSATNVTTDDNGTYITGLQFCFGGTSSASATTFYVSAMYAHVATDIKIADFDTESGINQATKEKLTNGGSVPNKDLIEISYSTDEAYGEEAGSLKVTYTAQAPVHSQSFSLTNVIEKDVSYYDYIEFYVYATSSTWISFYNNIGKTYLTAGQWTKISVDITTLATAGYVTTVVTNETEGTETITDINKLQFCFWQPNEGTTYYISAIYARKNAE